MTSRTPNLSLALSFLRKGSAGLFMAWIAVFSLSSCKEVFESDLSDKKIHLLAPSDSATSLVSSVNFYWDELDGASGYRIQIARPSFIAMTEMVTDSLVNIPQFSQALPPGEYQWRVRGETHSGYSEYSVRTLFIDSTLDLSAQQIILQSPIQNYITKESDVTFSWSPLYNASEYSFQLRETDWNGSMAIPEELTEESSITLSGLPEGTFMWGVRGESALSNTAYSTRTITTDYTAPAAPTPVTSTGSTFSVEEFTLNWTRPADSGSALSDSLYIYSDADLNTSVLRIRTSNPTYTGSLSTSGTYYWRVKCVDAAGNAGNFFSPVRTFILQP